MMLFLGLVADCTWPMLSKLSLRFFLFVALYPRYTAEVMLGQSVTLTTLFLGRLLILAVNYFSVFILSTVIDNW